MLKSRKIPRKMQPILWSQDVRSLDIIKDRELIIFRILAYGSLDDLRWLFDTYTKAMIARTFYSRPQRLFSAAGLNFVTHVLLRSHKNIHASSYIKTLS